MSVMLNIFVKNFQSFPTDYFLLHSEFDYMDLARKQEREK